MTPKHTTVLFVDDDVGFLEVIQNLMQACSNGAWEVLTAPDATRGLSLLREKKIDLMVIDVHMPVMDGVQFLGLLHRRYPNILKVVLTGNATEPYRAACLSNGAELFLEKPTSAQGWDSLYSALNELLKLQPEEGFHGVLRRVGLQDVLQMECLARSSSVLEISAGKSKGEIFVKDGQIIHAQVGELTGEAAFNHLMTLSGGQFNLKPFAEPPARSIDGSWEFLLMEAARQRDEASEEPTEVITRAVEPAAAQAMAEEALVETMPSDFEAPAPDLTPSPDAAVFAAFSDLALPPEPAPAARRPKIDEVLICSTQGDVLYEWQCTDANARIRFLQFLSQKSWQLRQGLPLGHFERLEIEGEESRIVTLIEPDSALFVRAGRAPLENAS